MYQNPITNNRNEKWEKFKEQTPSVTLFSENRKVQYKNKNTFECKTSIEEVKNNRPELFDIIKNHV